MYLATPMKRILSCILFVAACNGDNSAKMAKLAEEMFKANELCTGSIISGDHLEIVDATIEEYMRMITDEVENGNSNISLPDGAELSVVVDGSGGYAVELTNGNFKYVDSLHFAEIGEETSTTEREGRFFYQSFIESTLVGDFDYSYERTYQCDATTSAGAGSKFFIETQFANNWVYKVTAQLADGVEFSAAFYHRPHTPRFDVKICRNGECERGELSSPLDGLITPNAPHRRKPNDLSDEAWASYLISPAMRELIKLAGDQVQ